MSDDLLINSHSGLYPVHFAQSGLPDTAELVGERNHVLIDAKVAELYSAQLRALLELPSAVVIQAREENKSIDRTIPVFSRLVADGVRRDHLLIAIGGGIIQDIACFVASTLLRGIPWRFIPTTLLAQADSCIGSKSSINLGPTKNIIGTFYPPRDVFIHSGFLDTLAPGDLRSGIGEIIKVHAIEGPDAFDRLAADFELILTDRSVLDRYIRASLRIKQRFIEEDEFDRGVRNVFNYGHSFGHAIESATGYQIPHGIAISIGMDMANFVARERGLLPTAHYQRMRPMLRRNYQEYAATPIPIEAVFEALTKDKKNTGGTLGLILPVGKRAVVERTQVPLDAAFRRQCVAFLASKEA